MVWDNSCHIFYINNKLKDWHNNRYINITELIDNIIMGYEVTRVVYFTCNLIIVLVLLSTACELFCLYGLMRLYHPTIISYISSVEYLTSRYQLLFQTCIYRKSPDVSMHSIIANIWTYASILCKSFTKEVIIMFMLYNFLPIITGMIWHTHHILTILIICLYI